MAELSHIRRLCISLHQKWLPGKIFMHVKPNLLTVYVDEAGTHGDAKVTVVAGWMGRAEDLEVFERRWQSLLLRNGLTHLHAIELKQGKKQFRDKAVWPFNRRLNLSLEAEQIIKEHAVCLLSVILKKADFEKHYIGKDADFKKRRAPKDSKYGVCLRIFLSAAIEIIERFGGDAASATMILEAGAANQGAAQVILSDMYHIAPERARFIDPHVTYALKDKSPGVQAADLLAYPVFVAEEDGSAQVSSLDEGYPTTLPKEEVTFFRFQVLPEILEGIKHGQDAIALHRRRLGRYWPELDGFPVGWTAPRLRSVEGFVLTPPIKDEADPESPLPDHYVHLQSL